METLEYILVLGGSIHELFTEGALFFLNIFFVSKKKQHIFQQLQHLQQIMAVMRNFIIERNHLSIMPQTEKDLLFTTQKILLGISCADST